MRCSCCGCSESDCTNRIAILLMEISVKKARIESDETVKEAWKRNSQAWQKAGNELDGKLTQERRLFSAIFLAAFVLVWIREWYV